jgi:CRISPR-associated endoribonuclease Cas6/Csy4 subtype I-F
MESIDITTLCYVEFSTSDGIDPRLVEGVLRHVHAYGREHGTALGVDFPEWRPEECFQNPRRIRVLGPNEPLAAFIRQPRSLRLLEMGDVSRSAIAPVPDTATYASLRRDSSADKTKPSHAARRLRRGAGEYTGQTAMRRFSIAMTSKSTGMSFMLSMKKIAADKPVTVTFGGYGMCHTGAVPQF